MTLSERFSRATYKLYPHITRDAAAELTAASPERGLDGLEGHRYCAVVSYKRDGSAVSTPVWFGLSGGRLYFRTLEDSYKLRRIRRRADVLVAPCNPKGLSRSARPSRGRRGSSRRRRRRSPSGRSRRTSGSSGVPTSERSATPPPATSRWSPPGRAPLTR